MEARARYGYNFNSSHNGKSAQRGRPIFHLVELFILSGKNGSCKNSKFDSATTSIDFWIKAENSDEFCPTSVQLVLNDDQNTIYSLEKDMDCNYSKNTNYRQHTVKIQ